MAADALSVDDLLEVWDRAEGAGPIDRALLLRSAAGPSAVPADRLVREPIGERDAVLLEVLASTFGSLSACTVECPGCGTTGEVDVDLAALRDAGRTAGPAVARASGGGPEEHDRHWEVEVDGWTIRFRLPTTEDLRAVAATGAIVDPVVVLRERVLLAATPPGEDEPVSGSDVPTAVWAGVERHMAALDPLAELTLTATCHSCGDEITALLDPAAFLWRRVDVEVRGLLADVDLLARAYGWSEPEVLALSPARRRYYLDRLG